jgi:hypothetical protein
MISKKVCSFGELKSENINRAWANIINEHVKTSAKERLGLYELKKHTNHGLMKNV